MTGPTLTARHVWTRVRFPSAHSREYMMYVAVFAIVVFVVLLALDGCAARRAGCNYDPRYTFPVLDDAGHVVRLQPMCLSTPVVPKAATNSLTPEKR